MNNLERTKKQLSNLRQNKDISEEDLELLAKEHLERQEILGRLTFCINDEERKFAGHLLESYLAESSLESVAEKDTLRQLIDIEIILERVKSFLNTEYQKANPAIPTQMLDQLTTLNSQAIELKEKLGLVNKDKKQDSLAEYLKIIEKKALLYYNEHHGCNITKCPYCQRQFYLLLRTTDLTPEKCKMFKGTDLYNLKLMEMIEQNRITKEEAADVLGVNVLYVEKIYNELYLKEKVQ